MDRFKAKKITNTRRESIEIDLIDVSLLDRSKGNVFRLLVVVRFAT